jgi:hypothetical protein
LTFDWIDKLELTPDQSLFCAWRVVHQLLRVAGCDFGCGSLSYLAQIKRYYAGRSYWKEYLDVSLIPSDTCVQMRQCDLVISDHLVWLGQALDACKEYHCVPEIFGQVADVYAVSLHAK